MTATKSIISISIYMITLIIVIVITIAPNVSHSMETAIWRNHNVAARTTNRQRYSRDWKWNFDQTYYNKRPRKTNEVSSSSETPHEISTNEHRKFGDKLITANSSTTIVYNKVPLISSSPITSTTTSTTAMSSSKSTGASTTPRLVSTATTTKKASTAQITEKLVQKVASLATTKSQKSTMTTTTSKPWSTTVTTSSSSTSSSSSASTKSQMSFYHQKLADKSKVKVSVNITQNLVPLPAGAGAALVKPTKYHYYPHNQHIYLLPECAIQQVCNAVYVRLNYTQPLCACPSRYRDPCSASLNSDDLHTTELITDPNGRRALTLVKTCEPTAEMRECRAPRDWSLLALQNIRTGKSHYLVICRCSGDSILEGPISHDQPTYASVPGIRVYGMMCVQVIGFNYNRMSRPLRYRRHISRQSMPRIPFDKLKKLVSSVIWD